MNEKSSLTWHKFMEGSLPPEDVDVLAYNKKWIDEDFNSKGIRIGFRVEDRFYSAQWDGDSNNDKDELPEYWIEIPKLTLFKVPKGHKEFEPFERVLVREWCDCKSVWTASLYSHYDDALDRHCLLGSEHVEDDRIIPYEGILSILW